MPSHASRCRARVLAWPQALLLSGLLLAMMSVLLPVSAFAQDATLRVTVVDPSGAVIVGATVSVGTASLGTLTTP